MRPEGKMILSIKIEILVRYVEKQLSHFFPDSLSTRSAILKSINYTMERVELCFSAVQSRYFGLNGQTYFNHLNSDHYSMFLYFLANTIYKNGEDIRICEKIFYLNKSLHGIDVFYKVELPDIFLFCHPLGTVLGRAQYSNYFLVYQGCTVGASRELGLGRDNEYPILGEYLAMYMCSSILGKSRIGKNCKISGNSSIMDNDLPDNSIYIGTSICHTIKTSNSIDSVWKKL